MTSVIQQAMVFILIIFLACFIKLRGYFKESDSYVLALLITNITCPWTLLAENREIRFDIKYHAFYYSRNFK